eukprot:7217651-Pyramimonas_sp.AAC.1
MADYAHPNAIWEVAGGDDLTDGVPVDVTRDPIILGSQCLTQGCQARRIDMTVASPCQPKAVSRRRRDRLRNLRVITSMALVGLPNLMAVKIWNAPLVALLLVSTT